MSNHLRYIDQHIDEKTNALHYLWKDFLQVVKLAEENGLDGHLTSCIAQALTPLVQRQAAIDALKDERRRMWEVEEAQ
jgi:hypothetical protein